jgi:hypothetical protein
MICKSLIDKENAEQVKILKGNDFNEKIVISLNNSVEKNIKSELIRKNQVDFEVKGMGIIRQI